MTIGGSDGGVERDDLVEMRAVVVNGSVSNSTSWPCSHLPPWARAAGP
jgi:hypothetical protein